MPHRNDSVRELPTEIFSRDWPLEEEIHETAGSLPSHGFLANPSSLYPSIYWTRFVKARSEKHFGRSAISLFSTGDSARSRSAN
jgi:hypothetical protein